jgi:hypothetical protein
MLLYELLGVNHRGRAEAFREPDLILLRQLLIAQENDKIPVPGLQQMCSEPIVHLPAQIDADDFGAQGGRQWPGLQSRR